MKILASAGREDLAVAYLAETETGRLVEFAESVQPPLRLSEKWVLMISSLFGCPVKCAFCDAGGHYEGKLSKSEILQQLDFLIERRFPDRRVPVGKFKVQFARVGEPSLNPAVLDVLEELPRRYDAPGLMPAVSTVAPSGRDAFFERLKEIKNRLYAGGRFQLQFSIHTTDPELRDRLIPGRKWTFREIAHYGERFRAPGDRKITLNFALAEGAPIESGVLRAHFDPETFLIKITPVNPTHEAVRNGIVSRIVPGREEGSALVDQLRAAGYDVLLSIGEQEENRFGSNCGQYIRRHLEAEERLEEGYAGVDEPACVAVPSRTGSS
jgi:23S rRNA (adenine2503-C2)-methyltransferase